MKTKQAKTKQTIVTTAAIVAIAAIATTALVLKGRSTAAATADETPAEIKIAKRKPIKEGAAPTRAKPAESTTARPKSARHVAGKEVGEKASDAGAEKKAKGDNPFPRYLDMFRNDPEALAAEFEKEVEADRVKQRRMRDDAIAKLKLNAEQAEVFEKALDDLRNAILQYEQEEVALFTSGQMNMDTAADGRIWDSNLLLMDQSVAAREKIVRDAAVEIYNQLDIDTVSDSEKQKVIKWTTYNTSFSAECFEPFLQVYDKVYKNMGFGNGIFSWCIRRQKK